MPNSVETKGATEVVRYKPPVFPRYTDSMSTVENLP